MMRASILVSTGLALTLALGTGCNKASDEQHRANVAQEQANTEITSAKMEATEKANKAQAEADKKIAAAEGDFGKRREDFRHGMKADLIDLDMKVELLEAKAKKATGKVKTELDFRLPAIRAGRASFDADMKAVDGATALEWDNTKARVDKNWTALKALVNKAD